MMTLFDAGVVLAALGVFSILTVVVFATLGARLLTRLPPDYFVNEAERGKHHYLDRFPAPLRPVVHGIRNVVGLVLVVVGVVLLVLPGQGLLTIAAGLILMDFPGKFACERWVIRRPQVRRAIDWMRRRAGEPPMILDRGEDS